MISIIKNSKPQRDFTIISKFESGNDSIKYVNYSCRDASGQKCDIKCYGNNFGLVIIEYPQYRVIYKLK